MILYRAVQALVRALTPLVGRLEVEGLENIPGEGPFFLIANHQSYVDPVLIQSVVRREVATMAKSTQFNSRPIGAFLRRVRTFPVRRFQVDPQAVRLVLRNLEAGYGVGIYLEGERTWDGTLQPFRRGAIRLILRAGVPVIPCGISGAYDVWPRWDRGIRRGTIRIRFGEPMRFPPIEDRAERDRRVPEAARRLREGIEALIG